VADTDEGCLGYHSENLDDLFIQDYRIEKKDHTFIGGAN